MSRASSVWTYTQTSRVSSRSAWAVFKVRVPNGGIDRTTKRVNCELCVKGEQEGRQAGRQARRSKKVQLVWTAACASKAQYLPTRRCLA